jgi:hypothetical protein
MRGIPCGNSFISPSRVCRVGLGNYKNLEKWTGDKGIEKALERFEKAISSLNPEAQDVWRASMDEFLTLGQNSSKVDNAIQEIGNYPKRLVIGTDVFDAPLNMVPVITRSQFKWRNPITGTVFNKAGENGISQTNGVSLGKSTVEKARLPWIPAAIKYKKELEAQGKQWPSKKVREVSEEEVQKEWEQVKGKLWNKGGNIQDTDRDRNELEVVYKIFDKNPSPAVQALRDSKERAMVRTWLEHDKKSPVTGLPVKLPVESGRETTVDHITSYDELRKQNPRLSPVELSQLADVASNYYIVEAAPNNWKGRLPSWQKWIERDSDKNMAYLAVYLGKNLQSQNNIVVMNPSQFKERFPVLDYNNKEDREKASKQMTAKVASDLLSSGGVKYEPKAWEPQKNRQVRPYGQGAVGGEKIGTIKRLQGLSLSQLEQLQANPRLYKYQLLRIKEVLKEKRANELQRA